MTDSQSSFPSRRDFLKRAARLTGGMALLGTPVFRVPAHGADARTFTAGPVALELDGQMVDFLQSAEGGFPKAAVITEPAGPSPFVKKHIGPPKYEEITLQCDPVMSKPLFDWVAATLAGTLVRQNGFIVKAS